MHKLGVVGGDRVDFLVLTVLTAPVFNLACEDDVGGVLIWKLILNGSDCWSSSRLLRGWRWRASRWRRHQSFAFGDPREPMTLPGCVVGRLRDAMEFAWGVESLLVGESRLPSRPATLLLGSGPLFGLLIFNSGHLPTGGRRHRGLALVVALLLPLTDISRRSSWSLRGHFASCTNLNFPLHGGVGRGVLVCYDQQLVEGFWLVAEELVLEEGAFSALGSELLDNLHLVHALAGVPKLGPTREVVASRLIGALHAQGELVRFGWLLIRVGEVADEGFSVIDPAVDAAGLQTV